MTVGKNCAPHLSIIDNLGGLHLCHSGAGEREYSRSGHQSRKGRENIPVVVTHRGREERIFVDVGMESISGLLGWGPGGEAADDRVVERWSTERRRACIGVVVASRHVDEYSLSPSAIGTHEGNILSPSAIGPHYGTILSPSAIGARYGTILSPSAIGARYGTIHSPSAIGARYGFILSHRGPHLRRSGHPGGGESGGVH
eukprot:1185096-Prorocentrum_minimum.AAC.1